MEIRLNQAVSSQLNEVGSTQTYATQPSWFVSTLMIFPGDLSGTFSLDLSKDFYEK